MNNRRKIGSKSKGKNPDNTNANNVIGKGNVTPVQVAFIVDCYLAQNKFDKTRSQFRSEASSLISKTSLDQAPKSLMSLGELLDEYIWLKEQKVIMEQEKCGLAQERLRIQSLLQGMQGVMNTYNSAAGLTPPLASLPPPPPPSQDTIPMPETSTPIISSAGCPASGTSVIASVTRTRSRKLNHAPPIAGGRAPNKRKINYKDLEVAHQAPKKIYSGPLANYPFSSRGSKTVERPSITCSSKQSPPLQSSSPGFTQGGSPIQGSSVAKALFDKPSQSPTSNSSIPKTPPKDVSTPSDKSVSPIDDVSSTAISNHSTTPLETTPTNCTIISSKTIIVSPTKCFSIERSECTISSPAKANFKQQRERDHVKARLDFDSTDFPSSLENTSGDGSSTSESEKEGDIFDLDLTGFDAFGPDFSLGALLTEFGIGCENIDISWPTTACPPSDGVLELLDERNTGELGTSRDLTKHSSAVTEVAADKAVNGSDSITSVKSLRKCIRIVSPTESSCQENLCERS